MNESSILTEPHFSARASLAAIGVKLRELDVFAPIRKNVQIAQKTVKHTPTDKLYDAFISILAGAQGLVEINTRLRSDPALQNAFGRSRCAEQSVVQDTLDHCTCENVHQMEQAMDSIYRQHSQGYQHDYTHDWQILDVDMSGLPCGQKAAFATKGYFAKQRNRRGRQLGRVWATRYEEVVVDRLFEGTTQLTKALPPLMQAAEQTLELDERKRAHTVVRIDAGGGSVDDVNWLLSRGRPGFMARITPAVEPSAWPKACSTGSRTPRCKDGKSAGCACLLLSMSVLCDALRCAAARPMGTGASGC
jgi:hypothetical protein